MHLKKYRNHSVSKSSMQGAKQTVARVGTIPERTRSCSRPYPRLQRGLFRLTLLLFCLFSLGLGCEPAVASEIEPAKLPSLVSSMRVTTPLDFCGETVPLETQTLRERLEKELLITLWDRPQVILWLKRSHRYMPYIEETLKALDVPEDLKYVPLIESALRPHAGSPKGAVGFWQFLRETGRKYGLTINDAIDERRNLFASTQAAVRYFKQQYGELGSWTLAAAAFNMGAQGLKSEMLAQKAECYYDLYLPMETQRYLFRILSAKIILSNPEKYGFAIADEDRYPPFRFDRVSLINYRETPLWVVAAAAKTKFCVIKELNPEIRGHYLSSGSHTILVPPDAAEGFNDRYKTLVSDWQSQARERIYVVRAGDHLSGIAERFNVPLPALFIWNRLSPGKPIHPGDRLVINPNETVDRLVINPNETMEETTEQDHPLDP